MATRNAIDSSTPAPSMTTTNGVNYFDGTKVVNTSAGTISQVLTSNGAGSAPTYQDKTVGTVTSVTSGTNLNSTGTAADPIINLDSSPSVSGSITAGTGLIVSSFNQGVVLSDGSGVLSSSDGTNTYVLTSNGIGITPSWKVPTVGTVTSVSGGNNITNSGTATDPIIDLDATITLTTVNTSTVNTSVVNSTTFDTNIAAAGITISGTTISADGTDVDIDINITAKGAGEVIIDDLKVSSLGVGIVHSSAVGTFSSSAVDLTSEVTGITPMNNGGTNAGSMATTYGVNYYDGTRLVTTSVGTATHVLTSNGVGVAPTFQAPTTGTVTSVSGGNNINVTGTAEAPIVNLDSSPSVSGSITAGTGMAITTGDLAISSGKITLPATSSADGQITINGVNALQMYGTNNFFAGGAGNFTLSGGTDNIGIGSTAIDSITSGDNNIAIGSDSLTANQVGSHSIAIGYESLKLNTQTANVSIGTWSCIASSTSTGLTAVGYRTLYSLTDGSSNAAFGNNALDKITSGDHNLALGTSLAGGSLTGSDSSNVCIQNSGSIGESNAIRIGSQGTGNGQQDKAFIAGIYNTTPVSSTIETTIVDDNGQLGSTANKVGSFAINEFAGTNHTLTLADANAFILMDSTVARIVYVPINTSVDFPIGTRIIITRKGTGTVTISENTSVSIRAISTFRDISARYGVVTLVKVSANTWHLWGNLS